MPQTIHRKAAGLYSHFNRLEVPPGALLMADNAVIDRPGIVEKRRGLKRYGTALSNPASALLKFQKRLLVLDGSTLKRDSDGAGTWSAYSGTYAAPDSTVRITSAEAQQSLYFVTSTGIQKLDGLTGTPRRAGVPPGLDLQLTKSGTGGSWFSVETQVGYRLLWVKKDANGIETLGEPTFRESITNAKTTGLSWTRSGVNPNWTITVTHTAHGFSVNDTVEISDSTAATLNGPRTVATTPDANTYTFAFTGADPGASGTLSDGKKFNVQLTSTLPSGIVAGDFYEVYRTALSASVSADPGDAHNLVLRVEVTSTDVTNGTVTFTDTDSSSLGADLYTNPLRETATRANARPPWAKHIAAYKTHLFFANTLQPHFKEIRLLDVAGLVDNTDSITVAGLAYTFHTAEDIPNRKFQRFTTESTVAENVRKTMQSFCKVLNRHTGNTSVYAQYATLPTEDQPGKVKIFSRDLNTASFAITCNATATGDNFSPILPTSGTSVSSANDRKKNGLYRAKADKPEAVPVVAFDLVGSADGEILGIRALKDALLIHKEDGLFVLSGETDGSQGSSFVIDQLDPTLVLLAPASLAVLDNAVWGWTSQGIVRSSEAGSKIMSWPIEFDLNQIAQFTSFSALTHCVAYESDRSLFVFSQEKTADTKVKVAWRYNYVTQTWTRVRKQVSAGIVLDLAGGGDRLYLAHNTDPYILEERKTFQGSDEDFQDETIDVTVTATGTSTLDGLTVTTVTLTYTYTGEALRVGFLFEQGSTEGIVRVVQSLGSNSYLLTLDRQITVVNGAATVSLPIKLDVHYVPDAAGNAGLAKQFTEVQVYLDRDGGTHKIGFSADTQLGSDFTSEIRIVRTWGWGSSSWGEAPWGDSELSPSNPVRALVPRQHQWARALRVIYQNDVAKENQRLLQLSLSIGEASERTMREPR